MRRELGAIERGNREILADREARLRIDDSGIDVQRQRIDVTGVCPSCQAPGGPACDGRSTLLRGPRRDRSAADRVAALGVGVKHRAEIVHASSVNVRVAAEEDHEVDAVESDGGFGLFAVAGRDGEIAARQRPAGRDELSADIGVDRSLRPYDEIVTRGIRRHGRLVTGRYIDGWREAATGEDRSAQRGAGAIHEEGLVAARRKNRLGLGSAGRRHRAERRHRPGGRYQRGIDIGVAASAVLPGDQVRGAHESDRRRTQDVGRGSIDLDAEWVEHHAPGRNAGRKDVACLAESRVAPDGKVLRPGVSDHRLETARSRRTGHRGVDRRLDPDQRVEDHRIGRTPDDGVRHHETDSPVYVTGGDGGRYPGRVDPGRVRIAKTDPAWRREV